MKKIISFTLIVLLSLSFMCSTVFAATPQITAKNLDIHKSETFTVAFNISPKSGLAAANFELTYDHKNFAFVEYGYGEALDDKQMLTIGHDNGDLKNNGIGVFKYACAGVEGTNVGGELFFVTFKAVDTIKAGEKYEFKLTCAEASDKNKTAIKLNNITVVATVKDGVAPSKAETSRVVGDTSFTNESQKLLSNTNNTQTKTDTGGKGRTILLIIIFVLLAVIIASAIAVIVLVLIKKKLNAPEEKIMTNILADDADTEFLNNDALANETSSKSNEFDEIDEVDD